MATAAFVALLADGIISIFLHKHKTDFKKPGLNFLAVKLGNTVVYGTVCCVSSSRALVAIGTDGVVLRRIRCTALAP